MRHTAGARGCSRTAALLVTLGVFTGVLVTGPTGVARASETVTAGDATTAPADPAQEPAPDAASPAAQEPSPDPTPSSDPTGGPAPEPTDTPAATLAPEPTATATPTDTPTATETATQTPSPTGTVEPTSPPTPAPSPPAAPVVTAPASPGRTGVAWSFTFAGDSATCRLTGPNGAQQEDTSCVSPWQPALTDGDGEYRLSVVAVGAGGTSEPGTGTYELDTTPPPAPVVSGTEGATTDPAVSWTFTTTAAAAASCTLYRGTTVVDTADPCTSPYARELPGSGSWRIAVVLADALGNATEPVSGPEVQLTLGPPPPPTVDSAPDSPSNGGADRRFTWNVSPTPGAECRITSAELPLAGLDWAPCNGSVTVSTAGLADGLYRLEARTVRAVDGETSTTVSSTVELDTAAPDAPVVAGTSGTGNTAVGAWTWVAEQDDRAECFLSYQGALPGTWTSCASDRAWSLSEDGTYALHVRLTDAAGNPGQAGLGPRYQLDREAPPAPELSGPAVTGNDPAPSWSWDAGADDSACRVIDPEGAVGGWTPCVSPFVPTLTQDGSWTIEVQLVDAGGNASAPAAGTYLLDRVGPSAPGLAGPFGVGNAATVSWTITGEAGAAASCQLVLNGTVSQAWHPCERTYRRTLTDGRWLLEARLTDAAGNVGASGVSPTYELDTVAPPAAEVTGPTGPSQGKTISWKVALPADTAASCRLLRNGVEVLPWARCTGEESVLLGADGTYVWQVQVRDQAGNASTVADSPGYVLDTTAPAAPAVSAPPSPSADPAPAYTWTGESGAQAWCQLTRGSTIVRDFRTCTTPYPVTIVEGDGSYVLTVRLVDRAGNSGPSASSPAYVLDTTPPPTPVVTGTGGSAPSPRPTWSWATPVDVTAECRLTQGTTPGAWASCTSPVSPTLASEGVWSLGVRLTDKAGNVSGAGTGPQYRYDATAPAAPAVTPPASPGRQTSPAWSLTAEDGSTVTCRLVGPDATSAWGPCAASTTTDLAGRPEGTYRLEAVATDAAGNASPSGSGTYLLDITAPVAAVVTAPPTPGNDRTPVVSFTSEAGTTATCQLFRGDSPFSPVACTSPVELDLSAQPDGAYTVVVRLTDPAGNVSAAGTAAFVLDTLAPAAPLFTVEPATAPDRTPTWEMQAEQGTTLQCRLVTPRLVVLVDGPCASPFTPDLTGRSDGTFTLQVRAMDAAGNVGEVASSSYVLDSQAPEPPTVVAPPTPGQDRTPTWTLSTSGPLECRLTPPGGTAGAWAACTGTYDADLTGKADGTYGLAVRAMDDAGNASAETVSPYTLDTTAPKAPVVRAPSSPSADAGPTWTITVPETGLTAHCRLLRGTTTLQQWAACPVPGLDMTVDHDLTAQPDGTYRVEVRVTDAALNTSPTSGADYVYDTTAPAAVTVTPPPSPGRTRSPSWSLAAETGSVVECRFGAATAFTRCAADGRYVPDLSAAADGTHVLTVRAVDAAGNIGPESTSSYLLDSLAPAPPTVTVPAGPGSDREPAWTWTGEDGASASCVLTGPDGTRLLSQACTSPLSTVLAGDGRHTLSVVLTDLAGNTSAAGTAAYLLDTTPPAAPVVVGPSSPSSLTTASFSFTAEAEALTQCQFSYGPDAAGLEPFEDGWVECAGRADLVVQGEGSYLLEVRATDAAGNTSPVTAYEFVHDPAAPAGLAELVPPSSPGSERSPSWTFSAPQDATTTCRLTGPDEQVVQEGDCTGAFTPAAPLEADGTYVLRIVVTDAAGNVGANDSLYQLDTTGPAAPEVTPAEGLGPASTVTWNWTAEADAWECRLLLADAVVQGWAPCEPGDLLVEEWGEGRYAYEVVGYDELGNRGEVGSGVYTWDATPPEGPAPTTDTRTPSSVRTVQFAFPVPEDATEVLCSVRRGDAYVTPPEDCAQGAFVLDLAGQPDGTYTVVVAYIDAAGNTREQAVDHVLSTYVGGGGTPDTPVRPGTPDEQDPEGRDPTVPEWPTPPGTGGGSVPDVGTGTPTSPTAPSGGGAPAPTSPAPGRPGPPAPAPDPRPAPVLPPVPERGTDTSPGPTTGTTTGGAGTDRPGTGVSSPATPVSVLGEVSLPVLDRAAGTPVRPLGVDAEGGEAEPTSALDRVLRGGAFTGGAAVKALKDVAEETIRRPQLPLALLAVVGLFLLVQNRIDRRDPKLAGAPVDAEPDLTFVPLDRLLPRTGGATA